MPNNYRYGTDVTNSMVRAFVWIVVLVVAIIAIFYIVSNRRTLLEHFQKTAEVSLSIVAPLPETNIFVDGKKHTQTTAANSTTTISKITPGVHTIIVSNDAYWPWTKTFEINAKTTETLRAFTLPRNAQGYIITQNDPDYEKYFSTVRGLITPSIDTKLVSNDKNVAIWAEENDIRAQWTGTGEEKIPDYLCQSPTDCENGVTVFHSLAPIKSLDFFPGRNDVVIFSTGVGIYAVEMDKRGTQNFQPIFEGQDPYFMKEDNTLYIRDGNTLFFIKVI